MPEIVKYHNADGVWYSVDDVTAAIKKDIDDETKDDIIGNLNETFKLDISED